MRLAKIEETFFRGLMMAATAVILAALVLILGAVLVKGLPAMNLAMVTAGPEGRLLPRQRGRHPERDPGLALRDRGRHGHLVPHCAPHRPLSERVREEGVAPRDRDTVLVRRPVGRSVHRVRRVRVRRHALLRPEGVSPRRHHRRRASHASHHGARHGRGGADGAEGTPRCVLLRRRHEARDGEEGPGEAGASRHHDRGAHSVRPGHRRRGVRHVHGRLHGLDPVLAHEARPRRSRSPSSSSSGRPWPRSRSAPTRRRSCSPS